MALSRPIFFPNLRTLANTYRHHRRIPRPSFLSLRLLSFATPEEASADLRRRKRRQRIEAPLNSLRHSQPHQPQRQQPPSSPQNPNAPKVPEPVSALSGRRLDLHNRILRLIRENDLEEASLLTRHSVYSNCRPTIFTANAVLAAQLRQSKYSDLLSLHRFITQAGVAANIITHNLLLAAYCDCRKTDTALEHYKQLLNDAPLNPSPTTYRILVKGLVDNANLDRAVSLKDEMLSMGFPADPVVYNYLMSGHVKNSNPDGVFALHQELKEKLGTEAVSDGIVYGSLMNAYFLKGMQNEAMECYEEVVGEDSKVKMTAMAFNWVLEALTKNGRFDVALSLFDRISAEHNPPRRLTVNLGTFNVMVDGYCSNARFADAMRVFRSMGEKRCSPDTLSYSNLIEQLCKNGLLSDAEELYKEMGKDKGSNPDEFTYALLMDACFKEDRPDDAACYFKTMVDEGLRPNLAVYNKLVHGLVAAGMIEKAKSFYDLMMKKLKMDVAAHEYMMNELFKLGKADEVLQMCSDLLDDEGAEFPTELQDFVKGELSKEGREQDLPKLMEDKEREKAEAKAKEIAAAEESKARAKAAVASLIPTKLYGNKEAETEGAPTSENAAETEEEAQVEKEGKASQSTEEATVVENVAQEEAKVVE